MNAEEVIELLGLEPMEIEGGMWAQIWRDERSTAIYFLMKPGDFSALHRLSGPELWHHYAGAAVEMLLLEPDGLERAQIGADLRVRWGSADHQEVVLMVGIAAIPAAVFL